MPREALEHIPIYWLSINVRLSGHFLLKFSYSMNNKIVMGKKDRCAVFGCNNDRLFPEKYTVKDHISNTKSARKYKRNVLMPPGHPIILLKSN